MNTEVIEGDAVHTLKTWPEFFAAVKDGRKTFEVRRDDRTPRYEVGDVLVLQEYDPVADTFTREMLSVRVTYIVRGEPMPYDYCAMGIERLFADEWADER